jgi:hypothetical protein
MDSPESHLRAAMNGWTHPATYTDMALWDLYDLTVAANSKNGRVKHPHARPWDKKPVTIGNKPTRFTDAQRRRILARRGPKL